MSRFSNILFIDIETVPQQASVGALSEEMQSLWADKVRMMRQRMPERFVDDDTEESIYRRESGIYAEFGKVICISVGLFYPKDGVECFRIKSFYGHDERQLLSDFAAMLATYSTNRTPLLCGHNIKEFDVPYICRRMLVNGLQLPPCLNVAGKKPWEINFIDTMELWRFGDYKNYTSLKLLTAVFGIPSPKDDINGSQVANVYYADNNLECIMHYCEKDVLATARLYSCYQGVAPIADEFVEHV